MDVTPYILVDFNNFSEDPAGSTFYTMKMKVPLTRRFNILTGHTASQPRRE
jgi:hypothetical protein